MNLNVYRIEKELAIKGMTKKRLAELSGLHRQNISTILKRGSCESITAGKLAKALALEFEEIVQQPDQEATHEAAST